MAMEITQVLLNTQSADNNVRKQAEDTLRQFQEQSLLVFLLSLSRELAGEDKPVDSRKLAGLILENDLAAKERNWKYELVQRWLALDVAVKSQIEACLLHTLSSPVPDARSTASQVIAKLAGIELSQKQWLVLLGSLLSNAQQDSAHVKQAALEALGYLCKGVSPDVVDQHHVNIILTAIVLGMDANKGNNDVRLAATRALYNALRFAQASFSNDRKRHMIMKAVYRATFSSDVRIRQAAFECLVAISSTYCENIANYIQVIFNISVRAVREDEETVALQAIELWSSVYGVAFTADSKVPWLIKGTLHDFVPLLLETLLKQKEDQDQDVGAWNLAMAVGNCLGLVARTVGDDIVPLVNLFINTNIRMLCPRKKKAAIHALGSIMEGPSPDKLTPIVVVALNFMLTALTTDASCHLKFTTLWTICRTFEFVRGSTMEKSILTPANIQQIISALLDSIEDPNDVVSEKACRALYFLVKGYEDAGSSVVTPYFSSIVGALFSVTNRESQLRTAACVTLIEVIRCSTEEKAHYVLELIHIVNLELKQTVAALKLSTDDQERQYELLGLLCRCLQVIIQKLGGSKRMKYYLMQYVTAIMDIVCDVLAFTSVTVHKEAMLTIAAIAYAIGPDFSMYLPDIGQYLGNGLQNVEEYQVFAITVGVVGDICRALNDKIMPWCDLIMNQLFLNLSSTQLHQSVKAQIFSCFRDIALAIGVDFERYLTRVVPLLQSAADCVSVADDDSLRKGVLEAYSGILQAFKVGTWLLDTYAVCIFVSVGRICWKSNMDDVLLKSSIGVFGDLVDTLGYQAASLMPNHLSFSSLLNKCLASRDHLIKESAECCKLAVINCVMIAGCGDVNDQEQVLVKRQKRGTMEYGMC